MLLNCGVGEDSWESLGLQRYPTNSSYRKSVLNIRWKDWCWSWNSDTLATWCEELTHWKRPWCWESLKAGGEVDDRGWDFWMASLSQWTWVWVSSGSWQWMSRPGVLRPMGSQTVVHDWATELNWTALHVCISVLLSQFLWPFPPPTVPKVCSLCLPMSLCHNLLKNCLCVFFSLTAGILIFHRLDQDSAM